MADWRFLGGLPTIDVLRDAEALADIRKADQTYRHGDVLRGVDAVGSLLGDGSAGQTS